MIKRIYLILLALAVLLIAVPLLGPDVGLAGYRALAPEPGTLVSLPNGSRLNVYRDGSGPPAVIVHGHPGTASMMFPLAASLRRLGYSTITYDRAGYGYSNPRPPDIPNNPLHHADDLLQLLRALDLINPLVVGYSYGGGVAIEAARIDHGAIRRLALVASLGDNRLRRPPLSVEERLFYSPGFLRWVLGTEFLALHFSEADNVQAFSPEQVVHGFIEQTLATLAIPGVTRSMLREKLEQYEGFDGYQPELVESCAAIIHGTGDARVDVSGGKSLAGKIADSELHLLEDTGHMLVVTQPDRVAAIIANRDRQCLADQLL